LEICSENIFVAVGVAVVVVIAVVEL